MIQLKQSLNVVAGKGDRHDQNILALVLNKASDGLVGLGAQPLLGAHLRLPAQAVRVREVEFLHDAVHRVGHLQCRRFCKVKLILM